MRTVHTGTSTWHAKQWPTPPSEQRNAKEWAGSVKQLKKNRTCLLLYTPQAQVVLQLEGLGCYATIHTCWHNTDSLARHGSNHSFAEGSKYDGRVHSVVTTSAMSPFRMMMTVMSLSFLTNAEGWWRNWTRSVVTLHCGRRMSEVGCTGP